MDSKAQDEFQCKVLINDKEYEVVVTVKQAKPLEEIYTVQFKDGRTLDINLNPTDGLWHIRGNGTSAESIAIGEAIENHYE